MSNTSSIAQFQRPPQAESAAVAVAKLRAEYTDAVADALYQAKKLSRHARLQDARPEEPIALIRQIAGAAVALVSDDDLALAADYYAADCLQAQLGQSSIAELPVGQRLNKSSDAALIVRRWLQFVRGMYPAALTIYRRLAESDRQQVATTRAAHDEKAGA